MKALKVKFKLNWRIFIFASSALADTVGQTTGGASQSVGASGFSCLPGRLTITFATHLAKEKVRDWFTQALDNHVMGIPRLMASFWLGVFILDASLLLLTTLGIFSLRIHKRNCKVQSSLISCSAFVDDQCLWNENCQWMSMKMQTKITPSTIGWTIEALED